MAANNEIGTIEPVADIGRLCQSKGILFHTDAVQAYGHLPIDVGQWHTDMLSASAHKFNGPKGTGFLYIKNNHFLKPFIHGGSQEMRLRAGTENVAGIVGMGCAAALAHERMEVFARRESALRNRLIYRLCSELPYVRLNGSKNHRLSRVMQAFVLTVPTAPQCLSCWIWQVSVPPVAQPVLRAMLHRPMCLKRLDLVMPRLHRRFG